MRVDVQLNDDELALLSGYNRSTTMGIKKPGELQRELLSDMENIEEKREVQATTEEQDKKQDKNTNTVEPKEVASVSEDKAEEVKSAPVRVRSDFLSMLSKMAQPNIHEEKEDLEDLEAEGEDPGILPEDNEDEEDGSVLPEDEDEDEGDGSVLPEDEEDEDVSVLPEDEDEEGESVLPDDDDDEDEDVSMLPDEDDEYTEDDGILPADDEDAEGESVASEKPTTGITEQQEDEDDGYSSELPEDDDEEYSSELPADEDDSSELPEDEDDSSELPADEDDEEDSSVLPDDDADDYSVLPADGEDEEDASVLPDDEDEDSSVLPEDNEEVEDEPTPAGIQDATPTTPNVVEHTVSPSRKVQKSVHHATHQQTATPAGYSAPSVPLYDFILNNGGSMLIEDVKKYYPIDEVKKALNLGKIYRFGNKVGV